MSDDPLRQRLSAATTLPAPLGDVARGALAELDAPWRIALLGPAGMGKTTLLNRLVGSAAPVGLGGVTRGVQALVRGDVVLYDAPGLDGPAGDAAVHRQLLASVDAVLWVTDALRPLPQSERNLLAEALAEGVVPLLVAARADLLDAEDRAEVLERLRAFAPPDTEGPWLLDLRAEAPPQAALRPHQPAVARLARARRADLNLRAALREQGLRPLAELLSDWRSALRGLQRLDTPAALQRLHDARAQVLAGLPSELPTPALPQRLPPEEGRELAVALLSAGEVALVEWAEGEAVEAWLGALG